MLLIMTLTSCEKEEITPSIDWKVGIIHDATLQRRTLALEFQSSFGSIESVDFESIWIFEIQGTPIYLELHETDFSWQYQGRSLKGSCKTSLGEWLSAPNVTHKEARIKGYAKVNGNWINI